MTGDGSLLPAVPIRVLIVDDSWVFRVAVARALTNETGLVVAGSEHNGVTAMKFLRNNPDIDVVTLDLEMPEMNGIETLKAIRELNASRPREREIGVIMLSAHTTQGAQSTIAALNAGAFDFIAKPAEANQSESLASLKLQLPQRIRACQQRLRRVSRPLPARIPTPAPFTSMPPTRTIGSRTQPMQAIVIGVSTGGPRALLTLLPRLTSLTRLPIIIVQHMPPKFTASLAESLAKLCTSTSVTEAVDNDPITPGHVYLAPGGKHLIVRRTPAGAIVCGVNENPPENALRPNVDVMFRSAAQVWGGNVVAVILTGMGTDGTKGLAILRHAGALAIAQDEATSVVWGMPGSAVAAGLVDQVLPLEAIAEAVAKLSR
jgi:two-component system chemotaxis response regulator CheB